MTLQHQHLRPANPNDAGLIYQLYQATPGYFDIIAIEPPTLVDVEGELKVAAKDPHRKCELILSPTNSHRGVNESIIDPITNREVLGYLDYKLHYPGRCDTTVNLLLIAESVQSQGVGSLVIETLERKLKSEDNGSRVLASIYGNNARAKHFWRKQGYHFAIDAKPILEWYAKDIA